MISAEHWFLSLDTCRLWVLRLGQQTSFGLRDCQLRFSSMGGQSLIARCVTAKLCELRPCRGKLAQPRSNQSGCPSLYLSISGAESSRPETLLLTTCAYVCKDATGIGRPESLPSLQEPRAERELGLGCGAHQGSSATSCTLRRQPRRWCTPRSPPLLAKQQDVPHAATSIISAAGQLGGRQTYDVATPTSRPRYDRVVVRHHHREAVV